MRRYRVFWGLAVFFFVLFIFWHLFTLRTMPKDMSFIGPMLVTVAGDSLHGFLYLAMELLMLLQILPAVSDQWLVRVTRKAYWIDAWKSMLLSATVFCSVFCLTELICVAAFFRDDALWDSGYLMVWALFWFRMICVYMVMNGVFALIYSLLWRKETAAVLCVVLHMIVASVIADRWNLGELYYIGDLEIYGEYYMGGGLDFMQYGFRVAKHLLMTGLLYLISLSVFEKRDVLHDKK